ncbi:MAG: outer membrane protein assembly factor BamA [Proteobacteria bacterium]|nr:outer membrane protein assembly factor BamA [Pseudomonadota bacterium]HQR02961.1 outer membrane protein assembly factor BamA [Rhodocyclaceae bacterium]
MKKTLIAGLLSTLFVSSAGAFEPFTVKDIRVEGLQRTEAGTVFSYLPVRVGETATDEKVSEAIKALFATGFFKDVRIEADKGVLIVQIEERPAIAAIDFVGMRAFDKDQLRKALKDAGIAESRIFDRAVLEKAEQEIKRQYLSKGYYAADVKTTVTPLERNRVGLAFNVDEGEIAKIREINIVGAKAFDESDLLDQFELRTSNWLSWYTKNDQYSKQKLSGDLENLRSFYLNQGYLEFQITSTQVSMTPDKQGIYITVNVSEGDRYTVSAVKLAGNLLLPDDEIKALVKIRPGEIYSREKLTDTTKAISERLGNDGYAFANVNASPELDKEKHEAAFTIFVDPGRRVYVRRINIAGNAKTRDEVIRREMRQMESAWYDGSRINRSKTRVDKLGYFEEVTVETPSVPGTTDQVDVDLKVKEKPTGSIMLGAGFSSYDKLMLSGSIQQDNLFGSGKSAALQVNTSRINKVYSLSFTDPYYTVDGVSRGFDMYYRRTDTNQLNYIATYDTKSLGGGVRFGIPIGESNSILVGASVDSTKLDLTSTSPQIYQDFVNKNGNNLRSLVGSAGWARDTLDSRIYPTSGSFQRVSGELALPGSTLKYFRTTYQYQRFFPLTRTFTLMLNGEAGVAGGLSGKDLPFWKNFYVGGIGSVRGYETSTLGPKYVSLVDGSTYSLGGVKRLVGNAEVYMVPPGMGKDKSLRLSAFLDAGQVWGKGEAISMSDLRYSVGLALAWTSPMGPIKFSFAHPIKNKPEDKLQRLQFQMGTTF